jgi:hypothetical protein
VELRTHLRATLTDEQARSSHGMVLRKRLDSEGETWSGCHRKRVDQRIGSLVGADVSQREHDPHLALVSADRRFARRTSMLVAQTVRFELCNDFLLVVCLLDHPRKSVKAFQARL